MDELSKAAGLLVVGYLIGFVTTLMVIFALERLL